MISNDHHLATGHRFHRQRLALGAVLLLAMVTILPASQAQAFDHFITRHGSTLMDGDKPFRFVSVNIPNYFIVEDRADSQGNKWHRVTAFEQRDAARAVKRLGGQVFRTYVFSVEGGRNVAGDLAHIYADKAGHIRYNEALFRDVDRGLAIAAEQGVRVIIPLVDNWEWFGGYAEWAKLAGAQDFWRDAKARVAFKNFITWLTHRKNSVTGVLYKDDPTILAWELGNEIDKANASWISEMAAQIKRNDDRHLIIDGGHKSIPAVSLKDPHIDIVTTHYTDGRITDFATEAAKAGKAYIYGEFNPASPADVQRIVEQTSQSPAAGCLAWSLRFRTAIGGFYYHSDFGGRSDSLQYPGFTTTRPENEAKIIDLLRQGAYAMQNLPVPAETVPAAPTLLPTDSPAHINWQGAAGATAYDVQRRQDGDGEWATIATHISDAVPTTYGGELVTRLPLFGDNPGRGSWSYRIIAVNGAGPSPPSNSVTITVK